MIRMVTHLTVLVRDYNEALEFYTRKLGFIKCDDMPFGKVMRWLTVAPKKGLKFVEIVLSQPLPEMFPEDGVAAAKEMLQLVGKNPMIIVSTDDCEKTYEDLVERSVEIVQQPKKQPWGLEVIFKDLYGNIFCMIEPSGGCNSYSL